MGGGHDHAAAETLPSTPRARRVLAWVLAPLVVATVAAVVVMWPERVEPPEESAGGDYYEGQVTGVELRECPAEQQAAGFRRCGTATVRAHEGPDQGSEVTAPVPDGPGAPEVSVGDRVVLSATQAPGEQGVRYGIADHQRGSPLILLVVLFAVVIVAFGLRRGLASLAGLASCFALLVWFVLPAIVAGTPPLLVAVVGAAMVMFVIMFLVHGVSVRTSVAVLGTLGALVVTGLLGVIATAATHLTGFVGDDELTLVHSMPELDLRGVLLAGIIIGSLGVLDDISVSQAATVGELARADPSLSRWQLYRAGIRVGRAHVASVVNTLVLAYAGASLPLLLLLVVNTSGDDLGAVLTSQPIAQEIVRSVVATVGLVAAVPLTTLLAAYVCSPARGAAGATAASPPAAPVQGGPPAEPSAEPPAGDAPGRRGWPDRPGPRHRRPDPGEALAPDGDRDHPW